MNWIARMLVSASSIAAFVLVAQSDEVLPKTIYVDRHAPAGGDGLSWETAFQSIQEGVDVASTQVRDTVLVAPGVYDNGEPKIVKKGKKATARVAVVDKSVKILARDGKEVTHIVGRRGDGLGGPDAVGNEPVMCVFIAATAAEKNTVVEGFTIRDGELTADLGSVGPAGVGSPALTKDFSLDVSNNFYVAYCTISNCCAQRAAAMRGGTAIATLFTDNHSFSTGGGIENAMNILAYNSIFTRLGSTTATGADKDHLPNGDNYTLVNCTFVNNIGGRGTYSDKNFSVSIYNTAIVDNASQGDNYVTGVYTCVGDGNANPSSVFNKSGATIEDTVTLSTLVTATTDGQEQHQELFLAAPLGDFRPIDGGYLYGKNGHYGKIEYTNLDFIPPEYKQRDFYGNKLADDAVIPIGAILPPATPATRPVKVSDNMTVDGVATGISGEYIYSETADAVFRIGPRPGTVGVSVSIDGTSSEYLLPDGTAWCRPGAQGTGPALAVSVTSADGVFYVDCNSGSDAVGVTGAADDPFVTIQKAVSSVPEGMKYVVCVAEGTYASGGSEVLWPKSDKYVRARVVLTEGCGSAYVRATGRRDLTIVEGAVDSGSDDGSGANARRIAVNVSSSSTLSFAGFTFRKGRPDAAASDPRSQGGGGFLSYKATLFVLDSVVTDCAGASYSCGQFTDFVRCLFRANRATTGSTSQVIGRGVAAFCVFEDNPDAPNIVQFQSGSKTSEDDFSGLLNCTVYTPNATATASVRGNQGPLANTIVRSSARITALQNGDYADVTSLAWGCDRVAEGVNVTVANPKLMDPANGDYRPNWNSPAWKAGTVLDKFRKYMIADFNGAPVDFSADGTKVTLGAVHTLGKTRQGLLLLFK